MTAKRKKHDRAAIDNHGISHARPSREDLLSLGKSLRNKCPRQNHAVWQAPSNRPSPLDFIRESNQGRLSQLIPIRHGRMLQSPFAFYRGAALHMASDLSNLPVSGLRVQACGDCHLMNFGVYGTPERRVVFDINDLDETLPAPWEWDVKRLATSFVLACRNNGFSTEETRDTALNCVRSYREHMAEYSAMNVLDIWYASIDVEKLLTTVRDKEARERAEKRLAKAREHSALEHEFPELVTTQGYTPAIKDAPPLIFHPHETGLQEQLIAFQQAFENYKESLQEDRRILLERYQLLDFAIKVVGVGSVGTICGIILLMASETDPLFLQVKQARPSVLEAFAGKSLHKNNGQRIVHGYRMMQSASDLFLGWTQGRMGRQFYIRQLRDMKLKPLVELFTPDAMLQYAEVCGWALAHAHARSGDCVQISGYLGKSDKFDAAIASFSHAYANQTEQDYEIVMQAAKKGEIEVVIEEE